MLIEAIRTGRQNRVQTAMGRPSALAILAHDLRGPLTSLQLLIELIGTQSERCATAKISAYAYRAEGIIDRLDALLNSTLERVRDAGDPLCLKPETFDLMEVMEEAIVVNLPRARAKSISLILVSKEAVNVHGDRQLLLQVIENMIGNAVKHSRPNQYINCAVRQVEDQARVSVRDNGAGMTSADLRQVFSPFKTLSAKSSDTGQSWGLGLWIAKLIVEQHAGKVHACSEGPGQGSEFGFVLPLTP